MRGLSSLLILREIMNDIEQKVEATGPVRPCEYFDLIGGTSTGGLIAIMLGTLGMVFLFFMAMLKTRPWMNASTNIWTYLRRCLKLMKCFPDAFQWAMIVVVSITKFSKISSKELFEKN